MVGFAFYFLKFLMPFSGHMRHVAFLCHHTRLTDCGTVRQAASHDAIIGKKKILFQQLSLYLRAD